jgi:hypothetical protein
MRKEFIRAGAIPALAVLGLTGALALAPGANAASYTPTSYRDVPGDPTAPGYAPGDSSYDRGYAQGMRAGEERDRSDRAQDSSTYAPSSTAQTGPNTADDPRASEASTNQDEACGTNPGENDHTLGLPKLVNLNTC